MTLAALLVGAAPATAVVPEVDAVSPPDYYSPCEALWHICELEQPSFCDQYPDVCRIIEEAIYLGCSVGDHWTCVEMVIDFVNRLEPATVLDQDDDHVPDLVERDLCGRAVFRDIISDVPYGGSCRISTDYDGDVNSAYVFVPGGYGFGPDQDADGVPEHVRFDGHYVIVNTEAGALLYTGPGALYERLDNDDYDRNTPVPHDDADAVVAEAERQVAAIVAEAEAQAAALIATGEWLGALLFAVVEGTAAEVVETADETATYAWDEAMATWQPVWDTAEATAAEAVALAWNTFWWALGEAVGTVYWLIDQVDGDGDDFPDALEPTMCYVENQNSPVDGTCYYGDYRPPY